MIWVCGCYPLTVTDADSRAVMKACRYCGNFRSFFLQSEVHAFVSAVLAHKSTTTSPVGCEQQTRMLPSAGFSRGSG